MDEHERKLRIGTLDKNGNPLQWPKHDIRGGLYGQPATTQTISSTAFVVLPPGFEDWDLIAELKGVPVKTDENVARFDIPPVPEFIEDTSGFGDRRSKK